MSISELGEQEQGRSVIKKTFRVRVDVKIPVMVVVEAGDREEALAAGAGSAKDVIQHSLPERSKAAPYEYEAVEVHEMLPPKTMNA